MTDTSTVLPDDLARHGAEVAAAAVTAPVAALAEAAGALVAAAAGLPGGRATTAAAALSGRWELAAALWAADALAHGEALGAAAADYTEGDDAVATTFGSVAAFGLARSGSATSSAAAPR